MSNKKINPSDLKFKKLNTFSYMSIRNRTMFLHKNNNYEHFYYSKYSNNKQNKNT